MKPRKWEFNFLISKKKLTETGITETEKRCSPKEADEISLRCIKV